MDLRVWEVFTVILLASVVGHGEAKAKRRLDSFIEHFETLDYDVNGVREEHNRVRRENPHFGQFNGDPLSMYFRAHGRSFRLHLEPETQAVNPSTEFLTGSGERFTFDTSELFHGKLAYEPDSVVSGSVVNGVFRGIIHTPEERFHVEPARRYFSHPTSFHSIIYRASDVDFNHSACGVTPSIHKWMKDMQESVATEPIADSDVYERYSPKAKRERRQTVNLENVECRLKMAADHKFAERVALEEGLSVSGDPTNAAAASARVLASYVAAVNRIYTATEFGIAQGRAEMIQFAIKTLQVYLTAAETTAVASGLGADLIGVDLFLDLWSQANYNEFCLSYLFTYRDFDAGVLGLAWVASPGSAVGGVCDKQRTYSSGQKKTLNTGIVTFLNFGRRVSSEVSYLTFAHELGHNLGSPHDPPSDARNCAPGSPSGNYIMYAHATSGGNSNNNKFSQCSIDSIAAVLRAKALSPTGCFDVISNGSICGNGVRDGNEECDCGTDAMCSTNNCCQRNCTLKSTVQCSPQQGPCCSSNCQFLTSAERPVCSELNECRVGNGTCNGASAECNLAAARPNGTLCAMNTSTCTKGECTGSLCAYLNKQACFCSGDDRCEVCCSTNGSAACTPARLELADFDTKLPAGSPCDNYVGFCDFLNFCRRLDDQGPIARLKDALFSTESINNAYEWSKENWYIVLAGVIGLVIIMAIVVKFCSVHTESSVDTMRRKKEGGGRGGGGRGGGGRGGGARARRGHEMNNMR